METTHEIRYIAFAGQRKIAAGSLPDVAVAAKRAADGPERPPVALFEEMTARPLDVDLHGTVDQVRARAEAQQTALHPDATPARRGPGRPRLGVVSREVTLLPRHWDWLAAQPGGASASLRRLVDEARRVGAGREQARLAHEAVYRFMYAMAGDLPGYEEASRALYRRNWAALEELVLEWPEDVRDHTLVLAAAAQRAEAAAGEAPAGKG